LADHDYFCFFEAPSNAGSYSFSRAYINFLDPNDMQDFLNRFDNHVFIDKHGRQYPAVVERAFWHKSATSGPFYKNPKESNVDSGTSVTETRTYLDLEQDEDFKRFLEKIQMKKRPTQQSSILNIESNLDELTNASDGNRMGKKSRQQKVTTPLLAYVNQVGIMKNSKRVK